MKIIGFKDKEGIEIKDIDYIEPILKNGKIKFFEMSCNIKQRRVYPIYNEDSYSIEVVNNAYELGVEAGFAILRERLGLG